MRRIHQGLCGFILLFAAACGGGDGSVDPEGTDDSGTPLVEDDGEPTSVRVDRVLELSGDSDRGGVLYEDGGCADCHGSYASGTDAGPQLASMGFDLDYVYTVVIDGQGSMPSHEDWSDDELADLGAYLNDKVLFISDCRDARYRCD